MDSENDRKPEQRLCGPREFAKAVAAEFARLHGSMPTREVRTLLATAAADARFWSRVDKNGPDGCWLWTGHTREGYGSFLVAGKPYLTHRYAYMKCVGPIPSGLMLLHSCDRRGCVNPAHLRPGTAAENAHDMIARGRHAQGERHGGAKLSVEDVRAIRQSKEGPAALAKHFGVSIRSILNVRRRRTWRHLKSEDRHDSGSEAEDTV